MLRKLFKLRDTASKGPEGHFPPPGSADMPLVTSMAAWTC